MNKKFNRIAAMALALLIPVMLLSGCGGSGGAAASASGNKGSQSSAGTASPSGPVTLTDMSGREVKLDAPAQRIVVLTAADCEILFALGADSSIVGRGEYCNYPSGTQNITAVQSGENTNIEQIIALNPQVVVMSKMAQTDEQVASLEKAGVKCVMSDAQNIDGAYTAITMLGKLTGKDAKAAEIVSTMKNAFANIKSKSKGDGTKTIYFEVSPPQYGLWTAGSGTFMDEIAQMLGLKNAFADVNGWTQISEEQVIERNPDYIVTVTMSYQGEQSPVDELIKRAGWQDVKAVKNKAVLNVDSDEISRPGPRLVDAANQMYDFIYGKQ